MFSYTSVILLRIQIKVAFFFFLENFVYFVNVLFIFQTDVDMHGIYIFNQI